MKYIQSYLDTLDNSKTKAAYKKDIMNMLSCVNKEIEDISTVDLLKWRATLTNQSSATKAHKIGTVKRFYTFLFDMDFIDKNPTKQLKPPKINHKEKTPLTAEQVAAIIKAGKNARDKAIVALAVSTGLRISELINIKNTDIQNDMIKILGKGNKERFVYLNDDVKKYLNDYTETKVADGRWLFVSNSNKQMSQRALSNTLKCLGKRAGFEKEVYEGLHNHLLRTTNATLLLDKGVPVQDIQVCLGHKNIETTMRYAKISNTNKVVRQSMAVNLF